MNTWSVMLTVLVLNLHHRNECRPIPGWLRLLAFEDLARLLCMYTEQHVIVYQHRIQQRRKSSATAHALAGCQQGGGTGTSYGNRGPRHSLYQVSDVTYDLGVLMFFESRDIDQVTVWLYRDQLCYCIVGGCTRSRNDCYRRLPGLIYI